MIFECWYSQLHDSPLDDVTDWLVGSGGKTRAIVLVDRRSSQTTMTARSNVELYTLDRDGMLPRPRQREVRLFFWVWHSADSTDNVSLVCFSGAKRAIWRTAGFDNGLSTFFQDQYCGRSWAGRHLRSRHWSFENCHHRSNGQHVLCTCVRP